MKLTNLEIWKKSRLFRTEISQLTKCFPSYEKFKLVDQIIRSSRSVTANIAEGHGRFHFQENIQFCRIARGSLLETFDHLTVALDENYIQQDVFNELVALYEELTKMINGYINYLKKRKSET
ncbi:four helix bundle protein [Ekhidna sp.]|uniref:four helix bundle protein n=1 Tax=Ekhidna sp. TaxID=2608089 RepID=UPI00329768BE